MEILKDRKPYDPPMVVYEAAMEVHAGTSCVSVSTLLGTEPDLFGLFGESGNK
jgi:hypothetical protein